MIDTIERWQHRYLDALGRRLVYAADELYLLADRPFPALDDYDDLPQHENGIGMAATFVAEVEAALARRRRRARTRHPPRVLRLDRRRARDRVPRAARATPRHAPRRPTPSARRRDHHR